MFDLYTVESVKEAEKKLIKSVSDEVSMVFRAASGVAEKLDANDSYFILSGKGNNGADGFCLAYILHEKGVKVRAAYIFDEMSEAEKHYYEKCLSAGVPVEKFGGGFYGAKVVVDCIFGIGFKGEVKGESLSAINAINEAKRKGVKVFSIDLPSGLNADCGLCGACVYADKTFVIGALKAGLYLNKALDHVGEIEFIDIGLEPSEPVAKYLRFDDFKGVFPARENYSNKYDFGFAGIMGGSKFYSGAAKLANISACAASAGAGVVRLIVGESVAPYVAPYLLESTLFTLPDSDGVIRFDETSLDTSVKKLSSLAVGMGMTDCEDTRKVVLQLLKTFKGDLVIDADGLNAVKNDLDKLALSVCRKVVVTPHTGEFARLTGRSREEIEKNRISLAKEFALKFRVIVLLKGATTVVTDGNEVVLVGGGFAGQATAGSGDVLSGVIASFGGYMPLCVKTVACAAAVCNRASVISSETVCATAFSASDTVSKLKQAITELS